MLVRYLSPKNAVILFSVSAAFLIGGFFVLQKNEPPRIAMDSMFQEQTQEYHSVSLNALMEKEFDGRNLTLGEILEESESYTRYFITYTSGELTISGIMNVPKGPVPPGGFPVLFLNHGFIEPSVYTNGRGLRREQDYLARHGYVVIHSDYRNHAQSDKDLDVEAHIRLGYTEDIINAVVAAQKSDFAFINTERVGMLGHSMGGGIAQNILVVKPDLVDAAVLFAPVSMDARDSYERWTMRRPETVERIKALYGAPHENPEFWDNVSAQTFVSRIQTPVMVHQGTEDADVPFEWSERTVELLRRAAKDVLFHIYEGEPHEFTDAWPLVMQRTRAFFDMHLK